MLRNHDAAAWALLSALPMAILATALGELSSIPGDHRALGAAFVAVVDLVAFFPFLVALAAAAVVANVAVRWQPRSRYAAGAAGVVAGGLIFWLLAGYRPFATYLPFVGAWGGFAIYLGVTYASVGAPTRRPRWLALLAVAGLVAAVGSYVVSARYFDPRYPTLHLSLLGIRLLGLHAGVAALLVAIGLAGRRRVMASITGAGFALALVAAILGLVEGKRSTAASLLLEYAPLGQIASLRGGLDDSATCADPPPPMAADRADQIFVAKSGLPRLPDDFDITDYNVVLIMAEAVRYDKTSLGGTDLTPSLAALAEQGFSMSRAYSPSVRTWLTLSSLFSMTYQSHARIVTQVPPWRGNIRDEQETIAEVFGEAGYDTFAVRHGFHGNEGIDQGFETLHRENNWVFPRDPVDGNVAGRFIDMLAEHQKRGERFFGWAFFVSPHSPYIDKIDGHSRYESALINMDRQAGRILRFIDDSGLAKDTIVIFTGDHGEELGDHGRRGHGMVMFEESLHVPLIVRIPGVDGARLDAPTTSTYVFPWLLRRGNAVMRRAAGDVIRDDLAPIIEAVGGDAVVENWTANSNLLAIIGPRYKSYVNLRSRIHKIYDLASDPRERKDIAGTDPAILGEREAKLQRYLELRACRERASITRDEPPDIGRPHRSKMPKATIYESRYETQP